MSHDSRHLSVPIGFALAPTEWQWQHLESLCEGIYDCPHSTPELTEIGPLVVRTQDIASGIFRASQAAHVSENTYVERTKRATPAHGDLLYSREGAYHGVAAEVPVNTRVCLGQRMVLIRPDKAKVDVRFLRYWLNSPLMTSHVGNLRVGSAAPRINVSDIRSFPVPILPTIEQRAIGALLGALDDKIAANERIATSVDGLCEALLEATLTREIASFVMLESIAKVNARSVRPIPGGSLRYIDISSVSPGFVDWPLATSWEAAPGRARRKVIAGDTIWSTVRPNRRSHALILSEDPTLVASTGFAVLSPTKVGPAYLYEVTKRGEFIAYLESVAEGSAYPAVRPEKFVTAEVPIPPAAALEAFEAKAFSLRQRSERAHEESRTLAALRDILLPKLMSREICIKDAEKVVGVAT